MSYISWLRLYIYHNLKFLAFSFANKQNWGAAQNFGASSAAEHSWPMDPRVHAASGGSGGRRWLGILGILGDFLDVSGMSLGCLWNFMEFFIRIGIFYGRFDGRWFYGIYGVCLYFLWNMEGFLDFMGFSGDWEGFNTPGVSVRQDRDGKPCLSLRNDLGSKSVAPRCGVVDCITLCFCFQQKIGTT